MSAENESPTPYDPEDADEAEFLGIPAPTEKGDLPADYAWLRETCDLVAAGRALAAMRLHPQTVSPTRIAAAWDRLVLAMDAVDDVVTKQLREGPDELDWPVLDDLRRERDALAAKVADLAERLEEAEREADKAAAEALRQHQRVERALRLTSQWQGSTRRDGYDCARELSVALLADEPGTPAHGGVNYLDVLEGMNPSPRLREAIDDARGKSECLACREVKFIGHGPLCWDCYVQRALTTPADPHGPDCRRFADGRWECPASHGTTDDEGGAA